jgi:BASS family bile acid:Na+ symporter
MQAIIPIVVSITVIFLMWIVGLQLTLADFRRVAQRPKVSVVGVLGQLVTMPLLAAVLITLFRPAESIAAGTVLIASAPGAPISNLLVYLGRGNTALSVTMTAVTNTIGIVTFPLLASAGFLPIVGESVDIQISPGPMIGQLILLMLLPIAVGMITRKYRPYLAVRRRSSLNTWAASLRSRL